MAADINACARERSSYVCDFEGCDKRFKRRDRLVIHARTHTGERPFVCQHEDCGKSYSRAAHLVRHHQNSHRIKKEEDKVFFSCSEKDCTKLFSSVQSLKKHCKRSHSTQAAQAYKCEWEGCGETFPKRHLLRSHSYSHTGLDPYTCSYPGCSQTFKWPCLLRRHRKIHQGYKCDGEGCEQVFDKWTLLRHHKSKEHVQEYKCDVCGRGFLKKHLMSYHMQTHNEHRVTYPCPHEGCSRVYLDRKNLKTHQKRFHDKQGFPCVHQGCERTFASKQKLEQHLLLHDPNRPPLPPKVRAPKPKELRKPRQRKSVATVLTSLNDKDVVAHTLDPIEVEEISECHVTVTSEGDITGQRFAETVLKPSRSDIEILQTPECSEKESMLLKNVDLIRTAEECENEPESVTEIKSEMISLNEPTLNAQIPSDVQVSASSSMEINSVAI